MTNIMKIFAAIMIMVTFVVSGCQSNEKKYTEIKTETVKIIETVIKESEPKYIYKASPEEIRDEYSKKLKVIEEKMPTIDKNTKEMETLSKGEVKLADDFHKFSKMYIETVKTREKQFKERIAKSERDIANGVKAETNYAEKLNKSTIFKGYDFLKDKK